MLVASTLTALNSPSATADAGRQPGTLFYAGAGADSVSTLLAGSTGDPVGSGLTGPSGIAVGSDGVVYVADTGADRVVRIDTDGTQTVLTDGLSAPRGVAVDPSGNVFVADSGAGRVIEVDSSGTQELASGFVLPVAIAVAPTGHLVVADAGADEIIDLAPDGTRTLVGSGITDPRGVAARPDGEVVVADTGNDRVVAVAPDGTQQVLATDLSNPTAVAADGDGTAYVADSGNDRIVRVAPDGTESDAADVAVVALALYVAGQSISFSSAPPAGARVGESYGASADGGPSGHPVVFSADPASVGCTVAPGGTVTFIAVGTCLVDADQDGAAGYAPAPQVQQSIAVDRGVQTVAFTSVAPADAAVGGTYVATADGGGSGQPVVFAADSGVTSCSIAPDGTITFVHTGSCVVIASQDGDANWAPAESVQQEVDVAPGSQQITFTSGVPGDAVVGGTYVPSADGGDSGQPVTFSVDPSSSNCSIDSDGVVSFVHAGDCTVLADQVGDADWSAAPQATQLVTVGRRPSGLVFTTSPPSQPVVGQTYTAAAESTTGQPATFTADAASAGCTVASDGTVSLVGVGTCVIDAQIPGDDDNTPATVSQSFDIGRGPQAISFTSFVPVGARVGGTYVATATGGNSGQPVVFSADPASSACTVAADGTVTFIGVGTCTVDADQDGTTDYEPALRAQQSFSIARGTQTITFTSTPPAVPLVGGSYVATATGGPSGNGVRFSVTASSNGICTTTVVGVVHFSAVGNCNLVAKQPGSATYLAAAAVHQVFRLLLPQHFAFTSTPTWPQVVGGHYRVTAAVGESGKSAVFSVPAASASVCRMSGSSVVYLAEGVCTVVGTLSGTATYAGVTGRQQITVYPVTVGTQSPIRHVVLIFQENHSFDETLGAYCTTRATPCDGYVGPVQLKDGTVAPMTPATDVVPEIEHDVRGQLNAVDNGAMDGWAALHGCAAPAYACLTYYEPSDIPNLTALADQFVVSDRTFSLSGSPSWGGHVYAAAATLDGFTGDNPKAVPGLRAKQGWGCDSDKATPWKSSDGATPIQVPSCVPSADGSGPYAPSPVKHVPTIFDELDAQHLPWKIYGATKPDDVGNQYINGYGWSICPTFADCLYTQQVDNLVPTPDILDDAAHGKLPAYSVVTPSQASADLYGTVTSQHNDASMIAGDDWIGRMVSAIEDGPDWDSTAIFITYDDCGCFYDHVAPPVNPDGSVQGIRMPMVIVSPYAKADYTDSQNASLASVLAFTERNYGLPALSANDASAYDYSQSFAFTQPPQQGIVLQQNAIPKASIAHAEAHPDDDDPT